MTFTRYVYTYDLWCKAQPVWFNRVDDLTRPFLSASVQELLVLVDPRGQRFAATITSLVLAAVLLSGGWISTALLAAQLVVFATGAVLGPGPHPPPARLL